MLEGLIARARTPERVAALEAELAGPPLPPGTGYLWAIYCRLAARRGAGGFGAAPIGWVDLAAFQSLTGFRLSPWEVTVIEALDNLHLAGETRPKESPDG